VNQAPYIMPLEAATALTIARPSHASFGPVPTSANAIERRRGRRLYLTRSAELILGTRIFRVQLVDLSGGGCGIETLDEDLPSHFRLGAIATLNIALTLGGRSATLPLSFRNRRTSGNRPGFGFQFIRLAEKHAVALADLVG
jgi:hypothetical protein